jgi:uncharacterized delta-60 repeat protein
VSRVPHELPDGKLLIAGGFSTVSGASRNGIARLNSDGSLDETFTPPGPGAPGFPSIGLFAPEADGKIVVYGSYSAPGGDGHDALLTRLNADGSLDTSLSFSLHTFTGIYISTIATRENGDIVVGGRFSSLGDVPRLSLARITSNRFLVAPMRHRVAIPEGGTGYLNLRVSGAALPSYRWFKDGNSVPDGDRAVLVLRDFSPDKVGKYTAEVTSVDGSTVRSDPIDVVLSETLIIEAQTPLTFSETGGLGSVRVDAPAGTAWSIEGLPSWAVLESSIQATGSRSVSFRLEPNRTGADRTAVVTVAGQEMELRQGAVSARLVNISTRGRVGAGNEVMIVGFVMAGAEPIDILSRGVGPGLSTRGLSGLLPDPTLGLYRGSKSIGFNDNWDAGADRELVVSEGRRVGTFDLEDGSGDSAMLSSLAAGVYTAIVRDPEGRSGIALAEFYDRTLVHAMNPYNRVMNISTRGLVGSGDEVLIAGFVVTGPAPKQVLIRGVGPGLAHLKVSGYLSDPYIRVVKDGETVAFNDDWAYSDKAGLVEASFEVVGAFGLDPSSKDAAMVLTLPPGLYTVLLSGADGGEGIGLVEVYDLE